MLHGAASSISPGRWPQFFALPKAHKTKKKMKKKKLPALAAAPVEFAADG